MVKELILYLEFIFVLMRRKKLLRSLFFGVVLFLISLQLVSQSIKYLSYSFCLISIFSILMIDKNLRLYYETLRIDRKKILIAKLFYMALVFFAYTYLLQLYKSKGQ